MYVVSLPLPCVPQYSSVLMGEKALHGRFIQSYCGLSFCEFTHRFVSKEKQQELAAMDGDSWLAVHGEGGAHRVDRLLECVFWLVDQVELNRVDGHRWVRTEETVEHMRRHMSEWETKRESAGLTEGEFFAFKSRRVPFRVPLHQPLDSASTSSSSSSSSSSSASARVFLSPASPGSPASALSTLSPASSSSSSAATYGSPALAELSLSSPCS